MTRHPHNVVFYEFEGEQLTIGAIKKRVPCMSGTAIRNGLAKGRKTIQALLCAARSGSAGRTGPARSAVR